MSIDSLLIRQAELSDLRRELKAQGSRELDKCERQRKDVSALGFVDGENCISSVFQSWKDEVSESAIYQCGGPDFESTWEDAVLEGDVCRHCQNVRALKKQRAQAGRELGGVRAAITRVGRRLAKERAA